MWAQHDKVMHVTLAHTYMLYFQNKTQNFTASRATSNASKLVLGYIPSFSAAAELDVTTDKFTPVIQLYSS